MPTEQKKLHSYASAAYAEMAGSAKDEIIRGNKYTVWQGFVGQTARKLDIPKGTETRIMKSLSEMGCIEVIVKGVGPHPSVVVLFNAPTADRWEQLEVSPSLTRSPTLATIRREQKAILNQLGGVNLKEVIKDFEDRISALEDALTKHGIGL